jgi:predicted Zn finger-like uncharacterized protein
MKVQCPNCRAIYNIDESKIPEKGAHGTCSRCGKRFDIKKRPKEKDGKSSQVIILCPDCGHVNVSSEKCAKCGRVFLEEDRQRLTIQI